MNDPSLQVHETYEREFAPGAVVFDVGQAGSALYIIRSGEVELAHGGEGSESQAERLGAGDCFGEVAAVLGGQQAARAVARTCVRLLEVDAPTMQSMCRERPEVALLLLRRLALRLSRLEGAGLEREAPAVCAQLVRALLRSAEPGPEGARIALGLAALAREAGLTMLDAYRALRPLLERKLLRMVEDTLLAPDLEALAASVEPAWHAPD